MVVLGLAPRVAVLLMLTACTPQVAAPTPTPTPSATVEPAPTETAAAAPPVFSKPADCTTIVPQSRVDAFASAGSALIGGPGGTYPQYYADPTPQETAGGISCIWGDESSPGSNVEISVAPLSAGTRSVVIENLVAQGLNEAPLDGAVSYGQLGDQSSAPAVLNVIRDDSWISVIEGVGGQSAFEEAVAIADEVRAQVYATP